MQIYKSNSLKHLGHAMTKLIGLQNQKITVRYHSVPEILKTKIRYTPTCFANNFK